MVPNGLLEGLQFITAKVMLTLCRRETKVPCSMMIEDIPEVWGKNVRVVCADGYTVVGPYNGYELGCDNDEMRDMLHVLQETPGGVKYVEGVYVDEIESFEVLDG